MEPEKDVNLQQEQELEDSAETWPSWSMIVATIAALLIAVILIICWVVKSSFSVNDDKLASSNLANIDIPESHSDDPLDEATLEKKVEAKLRIMKFDEADATGALVGLEELSDGEKLEAHMRYVAIATYEVHNGDTLPERLDCSVDFMVDEAQQDVVEVQAYAKDEDGNEVARCSETISMEGVLDLNLYGRAQGGYWDAEASAILGGNGESTFDRMVDAMLLQHYADVASEVDDDPTLSFSRGLYVRQDHPESVAFCFETWSPEDVTEYGKMLAGEPFAIKLQGLYQLPNQWGEIETTTADGERRIYEDSKVILESALGKGELKKTKRLAPSELDCDYGLVIKAEIPSWASVNAGNEWGMRAELRTTDIAAGSPLAKLEEERSGLRFVMWLSNYEIPIQVEAVRVNLQQADGELVTQVPRIRYAECWVRVNGELVRISHVDGDLLDSYRRYDGSIAVYNLANRCWQLKTDAECEVYYVWRLHW